MFSIKIYNKKSNRTNTFEQTIDKLYNYVGNLFGSKITKSASDSDCIEIIVGQQHQDNYENKIVAELLIKKTIIIDKNQLNNPEELQKYILEINKFCEYANLIE